MNPTNKKIDGLRRWQEADLEFATAFMRRLQAALNREGALGSRPSWAGEEEEEEEVEDIEDVEEAEVEVQALALATASGSPKEAEQQSELRAQAAAAQGAVAAAAEAAAEKVAEAKVEVEAEAEAVALAHGSRALEDDQMELEDEGDAMEEDEAGDTASALARITIDDQGFQKGEEEGEPVAQEQAAGFQQQLALEGAFGAGRSACWGGDVGSSPRASVSSLLFASSGAGAAPPWGGVGPWKRGVKWPHEELSRGLAHDLEDSEYESGPAAAPQQVAKVPAQTAPNPEPQEPPEESSSFGTPRRMRLQQLGNRGPN